MMVKIDETVKSQKRSLLPHHMVEVIMFSSLHNVFRDYQNDFLRDHQNYRS
jgi:hypothetical protein